MYTKEEAIEKGLIDELGKKIEKPVDDTGGDNPDVDTKENDQDPPKVETPAVDTPKDPNPETPGGEVNESGNEKEEKPTKEITQPSFTDDDVNQYLSERLNGKFKSVNELEEFISEREGYIKPRNELIAKANEFADNPEKLMMFYQMQHLDLEKIDDRTALQLDMKFKNPDLSDEEIKILVDEDVPDFIEIDEETMDEDEISRAKRHNVLTKARLKQAGKEAKAELSKLKSNYDPEVVRQQREDEKKESQLEHQQGVEAAINSFEGIEIDLGNDKKFTFKLDPKNESDQKILNNVKGTAMDLQNVIARWTKEDGTYDYKSLIRDIAILENHDKIIKAAHMEAASSATNEIINDLEVPRPKTTQRPGGKKKIKSMAAQYREQS